MNRMDERSKKEFNRINQEKFLLSIIITIVFLIVRISIKSEVLLMLGEIVAAATILIYLVTYFIVRYKYKTIDEMVKAKLYKLSVIFFVIELLLQIPIIIIQVSIVLKAINSSVDTLEPVNISLMSTSFPFMITLVMITNIYSLVRMHSDKFISRRAMEIPLAKYKKTMLIRTSIISVLLIILFFTCGLINKYLASRADYTESHFVLGLSIWLMSLAFICIIGVPMCWFLYFYYLGIKKKAERKTVIEQAILESEINLADDKTISKADDKTISKEESEYKKNIHK